jgi:hypothetical protein
MLCMLVYDHRPLPRHHRGAGRRWPTADGTEPERAPTHWTTSLGSAGTWSPQNVGWWRAAPRRTSFGLPFDWCGLECAVPHSTGEVRVITASFDAASAGAPTTWYQGRIPRFLISSSVIIFAAPAVIIASKGQLGRRAGAASGQQDGDTAREHIPDPPASRQDPPRSDPPDV